MADNDLIERLRMEAQIHAQEARTAKATIAEIYQLCSGGNGEPGNWHGAAPVRELVRELQGLRAARMAYASEFPANEDGEPDVGSIHQNIRKLKAEAATLRQQAGRVDEEALAERLQQNTVLGHAALAQNTQGEAVAYVWQYRVKGRNEWRDAEGPINSEYDKEMWETRRVYLHAERARVPDGLASIGHLIATQDNRITDQPIFIVQQKRESVCHPDYDATRIAWVNSDGGEAGETERAELEAAFQEDGNDEPDGWRRLAVCERWEFVTACFTEQGCKDYLARNGHNLREPRIYAEGSYRNDEWRHVRGFLLSLAAAPSQPKDAGEVES